jgi:predicted nucleotidyltransferase
MDSIPVLQRISTPRKKLRQPLSVQRKSLSSVVIKSANKKEIVQAVQSYVSRLCASHPEVEKVIWFGSWMDGLPSPGSDVDLCLILSGSIKSLRDRIPDYLPVGFPVGIDLFPYTKEEFQALSKRSPGWYKTISSGKVIEKE